MKHLVLLLVFFLVFCGLAAAQSGQGYLFFAPGQVRGGGASLFTMHSGGGGKWVSGSGLGFGAEVGMAGPRRDFSDSNFGIFSAEGYLLDSGDPNM